MIRSFNTKTRALTTALVIAFLFFFFSSPLGVRTKNLIFVPGKISNIEVVQKSNEVSLTWSIKGTSNLKKYIIEVDGKQRAEVEKTVNNYLLSDLQNGKPY
jgi:hypothetical protein